MPERPSATPLDPEADTPGTMTSGEAEAKLSNAEEPKAADDAEAADAPKQERIAKVIARAGVASRRQAEALIDEGRVKVNGELLLTPAFTVSADDAVTVDGAPLPTKLRTRAFLFHKPRGLVTTNHDPDGRPTIFDSLPSSLPRVVTVGRLDINTEGLLIVTNDGGLARILELPATGWTRKYRVRVHGAVDEAALKDLREGTAVDGVLYGPIEAKVDRAGDNSWLTVSLTEGKNREIKVVLGALGLQVTRLIRVSFGPFQLGDLPRGEVKEIPTRLLKDQLGPRLAAEAEADFDSPVTASSPRATPRRKPRDSGGPRREERPNRPRDGGDRQRGRSFGDGERPRFGGRGDDRGDRDRGGRDRDGGRNFGDRPAQRFDRREDRDDRSAPRGDRQRFGGRGDDRGGYDRGGRDRDGGRSFGDRPPQRFDRREDRDDRSAPRGDRQRFGGRGDDRGGRDRDGGRSFGDRPPQRYDRREDRGDRGAARGERYGDRDGGAARGGNRDRDDRRERDSGERGFRSHGASRGEGSERGRGERPGGYGGPQRDRGERDGRQRGPGRPRDDRPMGRGGRDKPPGARAKPLGGNKAEFRGPRPGTRGRRDGFEGGTGGEDRAARGKPYGARDGDRGDQRGGDPRPFKGGRDGADRGDGFRSKGRFSSPRGGGDGTGESRARGRFNAPDGAAGDDRGRAKPAFKPKHGRPERRDGPRPEGRGGRDGGRSTRPGRPGDKPRGPRPGGKRPGGRPEQRGS